MPKNNHMTEKETSRMFYNNKKKEGVDIQGHINIPGHIVKEH